MSKENDEDNFTYVCYKYLEDNVIAEYVAFYLSYGYNHNVLGCGSFMQHFNSAVDIFNSYFTNENKVIADVKKILEQKYHLKIVDEKQLKFDKI